MCGATVQSMNHVRAMAETKLNKETNRMEITDVTETRLTGFVIHSMLASTILLLPLIKKIPIPVVSGVFLVRIITFVLHHLNSSQHSELSSRIVTLMYFLSCSFWAGG
jgi:hypothetical protein